jgi:hypothetical protein
MQKGMKPKDAAAKAFESLVGFKYEFEDTWRVPKAALGGDTTVSTLRSGAEAVKRDIGSDKPGARREGRAARPIGDARRCALQTPSGSGATPSSRTASG